MSHGYEKNSPVDQRLRMNSLETKAGYILNQHC